MPTLLPWLDLYLGLAFISCIFVTVLFCAYLSKCTARVIAMPLDKFISN